jgi:hypothetical protein
MPFLVCFVCFCLGVFFGFELLSRGVGLGGMDGERKGERGERAMKEEPKYSKA